MRKSISRILSKRIRRLESRGKKYKRGEEKRGRDVRVEKKGEGGGKKKEGGK